MSQAEVDRIVVVGAAFANQAHTGSFYSWGGDNHLNLTLKGRDEQQFRQRYNQAPGGGSNAGPGLYISTSLSDSANYCPNTNGVLLQVDVPDTMPYICVTDHVIMNQLRNGVPAVNTQMLYRNGADTPPILLNHTATWHCLKTTKGVGFRLFDGRGSTAATIQNALNAMRTRNQHVAVNVLLGQLRADMRAQVH